MDKVMQLDKVSSRRVELEKALAAAFKAREQAVEGLRKAQQNVDRVEGALAEFKRLEAVLAKDATDEMKLDRT